jgi:hypothetical protein
MQKRAIDMTCARSLALLATVLTLAAGSPAFAQGGPVSYDAGKTPAQLFASDCGICHKSPVGLSKGGGIFGLQGFLREHYTSSRQSAALLATYLQSMDAAAGQGAKPAPKRGARPEGATARRSKPSEAKPGEGKPSDAKPETNPDTAAAKPAETRPAEAKPVDSPPPAAPADAKPAPAPADPKPAEAPKAD